MALTATHENGTTWQFGIAIDKKRGAEHARKMNGNAVRNYCRKKGIPGNVSIYDPANGNTFEVVICEHYTLAIPQNEEFK